MRVTGLQHDIVWEDDAANLARLAPRIARAAAEGADLVLLSEMFATGFSMDTDRIAQLPDAAIATFLAEQATTHGAWVGGSLAERGTAPRPQNTFVLAGPQGEVHRYAKIHPFSYGGEDRHFSSGTEVITVDIGGVRVTPFVCYDLRFADSFWDAAPDTDAYVVVANWPASRRAHWLALLQARAIENQAYVVGVNRVGEGGGLTYAGDSRIFDPLGVAVASAGDGEAVVSANLEPATVAEVRARYPFLADRSPPVVVQSE